eukprot:NODE_8672_length_348_cov_53.230769_g6914_i0.p4 GENE.NODE_8672_length_348_cov_53.230769_g6914_i0~~NODE_8672_length_348_cov_53.230769_g6914_i0.p4  ORF type:complete len:86 (+),score=30.28 NODE_8672_length_348_cov_53.230769_g6914_i0:23-259(+)
MGGLVLDGPFSVPLSLVDQLMPEACETSSGHGTMDAMYYLWLSPGECNELQNLDGAFVYLSPGGDNNFYMAVRPAKPS